MTEKKCESRAVIAPLQGGGMVMFSCTSEGADAVESYLDAARAKRQLVDIADIVNAVKKSEKP
jgi:hypothetical protein